MRVIRHVIFENVDFIEIEHNHNQGVFIKLVIGGQQANHLVSTVSFPEDDPLNKVQIHLRQICSGDIQILDDDKIDAQAVSAIEKASLMSTPMGSHVFELSSNLADRWKQYQGNIRFPFKLSYTPSNIGFSNVDCNGLCDLFVTKIDKHGFNFCITASCNKKFSSINFDWEVIR